MQAMRARVVVGSLVLASLPIATEVAAQPNVRDVEELVHSAPPTSASYAADHAISRSYLVPAIELVVFNVSANLAARIAGVPWADVTPDTMWRNLSNPWVYDSDLFSVNQLAHPYGGAMLYSSARSSGHGFWTSAAYGFAGSLFWEALMEAEPPSINDQITTSIAGAFLGEALQRWSRAVRWGGGPSPSIGRQVLASVIDPAGAANLAVFGERWRHVPPPKQHALIAVGYNASLDDTASGPFHAELAVSHGLPSDPRFVPRVPFDHFDLRGQLNAGSDAVTGYLELRGLLVGTTLGVDRRRALWGLFGTYDYWDAEGVRAGAIGLGPGIALHAAIDERTVLAASGVAALVPWGAAGGTADVEGRRDYHHGPGGSQLVELKLVRRGLGVVRLSARAIEIYGRLRGDASEAVVVTSAGVMAALASHHAIGVDVVYSAHHATFTDAATTAFDQAAQVRVMYAVTSDSGFGVGD